MVDVFAQRPPQGALAEQDRLALVGSRSARLNKRRDRHVGDGPRALLRQGTIVDATIISTPSSTKNSTGERDPEMHQTRKGVPAENYIRPY